ncbi:MAG: DinB family protein [Dongiaceae bacterium]
MADSTVYFRAMARNNAWANYRLLGACVQLTDDAFQAERTSFFPSLMLTLNHILTVDWFYVDALEGGTLGPAAWADEVPCKTAAQLATAQKAVDQRLIDFCNGLDDAGLAETCQIRRENHIQVDRNDRILLHVFMHQVHHRGQAHAMLAGTGIAPPQLDEFFPAEDARLRGADLAALGWQEAEIWRGL